MSWLRRGSKKKEKPSCPNMEGCEMYKLFKFSGTLKVWKTNYCTSEFTTCARYERSQKGEAVPVNLMPNGATLEV